MADMATLSALAQRRSKAGPAELASPRLVMREVEGLSLFALTADFARHEGLRAKVEAALGIDLPAAGTPSGTDPLAIWQGPNDILFVAIDTRPFAILKAVLLAEPALLHDVTHAMSVIEVSGSAVPMICAWTMQGECSRVGRLAGLRVTQLLTPDGAVRFFLPGCDADYLWAWIAARMPALAEETP